MHRGPPIRQEPTSARAAGARGSAGSAKHEDVDGEHIEIHRLEVQQQRLGHRGPRIAKEDRRIGVVLEIGSAKFRGGISHLRDVKGEQEQMGDIDLPNATENPGAADRETLLPHLAAIDQGSRVPGNKDEDFRRIAETVIADGDPAGDIDHAMRWNVVEEDHPKRQSSKEIQPKITLHRHT